MGDSSKRKAQAFQVRHDKSMCYLRSHKFKKIQLQMSAASSLGVARHGKSWLE
jgi:hypothetical protein